MEIKRQLCDIYSRVVGWYTPIKNFNPGKKSERLDRVNFKIKDETNN